MSTKTTKRGPIEPMATQAQATQATQAQATQAQATQAQAQATDMGKAMVSIAYGQFATVREFTYASDKLNETATMMVSTLNRAASDVVLAQIKACQLLGDVYSTKEYEKAGFDSLNKFACDVLDKSPDMANLYARVGKRFFSKPRKEYPPTYGDFLYSTPPSILNEVTTLNDSDLIKGLETGALKQGMTQSAIRDWKRTVKPPKAKVLSKEDQSTKDNTDSRDMTTEQQFSRLAQEVIRPLRLTIKASWVRGVTVKASVIPADVGDLLKEAAPTGKHWDILKEVDRGVWAGLLCDADTLYSMLATVEDEEEAKAKDEAKEAERKAIDKLKVMFPDKSLEELQAIMAAIKAA